MAFEGGNVLSQLENLSLPTSFPHSPHNVGRNHLNEEHVAARLNEEHVAARLNEEHAAARLNEEHAASRLNEEHVAARQTSDSRVSQDSSLHGMKGECWGVRHTLVLLGFLGTTVLFSCRTNLSVAIVAMVGTHQSDNITSSLNVTNACPVTANSTSSQDDVVGEFDWDEQTQGLVLSSFFWGYCLTQFAGGRAAEYIGGRLMLGLGVGISSALTIVSPFAARSSVELFMVVRFFEGISQGVSFPSLNTLLATWFVPEERGMYTTIVMGGQQIGTVIAMALSGFMCTWLGWPSVFFLFGGLGVLWSALWLLLIHDRPEQHPRISDQELKLIVTHTSVNKTDKAIPIPWLAIWTSLPVWAVYIVCIGNSFGFYTLLTELPTYLKNIQNIDINSAGILSALPYLCLWLFSYVWSFTMDRTSSAGKLTTLNVRRISMVVGEMGPALGFIVMCFVGCNSTLAVAVLCVSFACNGAVYCGFICSMQDLAPNLAGTIYGFTNTFGAICGFVAPITIGAITQDNQTLNAWRTVFLLSASVFTVCLLFYVVFIDDKIQPWNTPKEKVIRDETAEFHKSLDLIKPKEAAVPKESKQ